MVLSVSVNLSVPVEVKTSSEFAHQWNQLKTDSDKSKFLSRVFDIYDMITASATTKVTVGGPVNVNVEQTPEYQAALREIDDLRSRLTIETSDRQKMTDLLFHTQQQQQHATSVLPVHKGQRGEDSVYNAVLNYFKDGRLQKTATSGYAGDFVFEKDNVRVLIEVKDTSILGSTRDIDKFHRDVRANRFDAAILVSCQPGVRRPNAPNASPMEFTLLPAQAQAQAQAGAQAASAQSQIPVIYSYEHYTLSDSAPASIHLLIQYVKFMRQITSSRQNTDAILTEYRRRYNAVVSLLQGRLRHLAELRNTLVGGLKLITDIINDITSEIDHLNASTDLHTETMSLSLTDNDNVHEIETLAETRRSLLEARNTANIIMNKDPAKRGRGRPPTSTFAYGAGAGKSSTVAILQSNKRTKPTTDHDQDQLEDRIPGTIDEIKDVMKAHRMNN
eukprot:1472512-Pyramimonas_sp.AAC.1